MTFSDVVNQLHNQHSFSDTSTTEKTNLSSLGVRGQQVNNLDTSDQNFIRRGQVLERRGVSVNGASGLVRNGTSFVNGVTDNVHDTAKSTVSDGDGDGTTGGNNVLASGQTLSGVHSNSTNVTFTTMLSDLKDKATTRSILDDKGIQHRGEIISVELDIDDGTHNLRDLTNQLAISSFVGATLFLEGLKVEGIVTALISGGKGRRTGERKTSARTGE
mmetsp:Transcript_407/g.687  ORF Transcript_407/g.687 Transcript_407/m.687 type:complete len:217 (+) Transcript_407:1413-2063(+)